MTGRLVEIQWHNSLYELEFEIRCDDEAERRAELELKWRQRQSGIVRLRQRIRLLTAESIRHAKSNRSTVYRDYTQGI
jgi:hypothetical protein